MEKHIRCNPNYGKPHLNIEPGFIIETEQGKLSDAKHDIMDKVDGVLRGIKDTKDR